MGCSSRMRFGALLFLGLINELHSFYAVAFQAMINNVSGKDYHCRHLHACVGGCEEETTASFEHLTDQFDVHMGEIIEEDFQTVENDVLRSDAEFSEFCNIPNIQKAHIRQRFLSLQPSKVATQLKLTSATKTRTYLVDDTFTNIGNVFAQSGDKTRVIW